MKLKQIQDVGTAAQYDVVELPLVGQNANKILILDSNAKLPALDGSQLQNVPGGGSSTAALLTLVNVPGTGDYTVPSSPDNGTVYYIDFYSATTNLYIYLPAANSFSSGFYLTFARNDSARLGLIAPATSSGDSVAYSTSGYVLRTNASVTLVTDGVSNWYPVGYGSSA